MNILYIKQMLYYQRHFFCGLELHERSKWRSTAPDIQQSFSGTILSCVYCKLIHTQRLTCSTQLLMTTNLMYVITAYYTPKVGFTANHAMFYKNKVGQLLHITVSFQFILYANVKIAKRYYCASLGVCCQAEKKEQKLSVKGNNVPKS